MKKILGLDLGVGSVGWSVVSCDDEHKPVEILGMGSRIVPLPLMNRMSSRQEMLLRKIRAGRRNVLQGRDMTGIS